MGQLSETAIERVKHNVAWQLDNKSIIRDEAVELAKKAGLPHWIWGEGWGRNDVDFRRMFDPPSNKPITEAELLRGLERSISAP